MSGVKAIFRVVFRFRNGLNGARVFKIAIQILTNKLNEFQTIGRGTEYFKSYAFRFKRLSLMGGSIKNASTGIPWRRR